MQTDRHAKALAFACAGDWDGAHRLVQNMSDPLGCWIHAVLHKMEGDAHNSRYWYERSAGHHYEDHPDPRAELDAIAAFLRTE
jgi:hypothetical protein